MTPAYMEYDFATPALRELVGPAWGVSYAASTDSLPGLIVPDAQVEFVFQLGAPCMISGSGKEIASHRAMIFALRHGAVRLQPAGANAMVAFRLPTVIATVVLGGGVGECWDRPVPLSEFAGADADDLLDAIAGASITGAGPLIESWLLARLTAWGSEHARLVEMQSHLFWELTDQRVSALADTLGFTDRTLRRHCETYAGLSPKQLVMSGRILRGCDLLLSAPQAPLADTAYRLGFNDQAAFTNAFRHYVGMTPRELRAEPLVHYERRR